MAKTLMIVDDSATMRKIIMRTVRMSGLEFDNTEEAGNGAEALEKLKAGPVDIVLCDINMPEMSGTEMVKQARQLGLKTPLYGAAALDSREFTRLAGEAAEGAPVQQRHGGALGGLDRMVGAQAGGLGGGGREPEVALFVEGQAEAALP